MSSDQRTKGRVILENRSATEILKDLGIEHNCTEEELLRDEFVELMWDNEDIFKELPYAGYAILAKGIYKILELDEVDDVYCYESLVPNGDGSFSFDYFYYNGAACWEELLSDEIEKLQNKIAGELIDEVLEEETNSKSS